jgi:hypothetical protein
MTSITGIKQLVRAETTPRQLEALKCPPNDTHLGPKNTLHPIEVTLPGPQIPNSPPASPKTPLACPTQPLEHNSDAIPPFDESHTHPVSSAPDWLGPIQSLDPSQLLDPNPNSPQFPLNQNGWGDPGLDIVQNPWAESAICEVAQQRNGQFNCSMRECAS